MAFPVPAKRQAGVGSSSWGGGLRTVAGAEARGEGRQEACLQRPPGAATVLEGENPMPPAKAVSYPSSVNGPGAHTRL